MSFKRELWKEFLCACCESPERADRMLASSPELLEQRDGVGETPLHYLALENRLDAVAYLISRGADVNTRDDFQNSTLMNVVKIGKEEMARLLVSKGADPNACDELGDTALHDSAYMGSLPMLKLLLELGADPNVVSGGGYTPADEALFNHQAEALKILQSFGGRMNSCHKCGYILRGITEPRCPECGTPVAPAPEPPAR